MARAWHEVDPAARSASFLGGSWWSNGGSNTPTTSAPSVVERCEIAVEEATQSDAKPLEVLALCAPQLASPGDVVERALAVGLVEAAVAGRFDVVAQLVRELEARRVERRGHGVAVESPQRQEEPR